MADRRLWPRIIVVTDRHRLVRAADAAPDEWPHLLLAQVAGALTGGADLVHVREPDLDAGPLTRFLRRLFEQVAGSADRIVVNDRADVAWVTGAAGVHLTEASLSVGEVRSLLPAGRPWVIGRSVHDAATAEACREASYLVAGTIQPSASKPPGWHVMGWTGLAAVVRSAGETPVVAIGGLGRANMPAVRQAGAAGVAGIGCFLPGAGEDIAQGAHDRVRAMRKAFDTVGGEPYTRSAGV